MPSPFPGMDPYLENPDLWPDVHHNLIGEIQAQLQEVLRPLPYVARVEQRTFLFEPDDPASELYVVPDARIIEGSRRVVTTASGSGGVATQGAVATAPPIDVTGMEMRAARERFLEIRDSTNRRVVTVIEVLSPSNKIPGSAGRRAFIEKRGEVRSSDASWVEIDLLRGGSPTWHFATVPDAAYRAYEDRKTTDSRKQWAWAISLREALPKLPVPLAPGELDVPLDLQAVLRSAQVRGGYDKDTDYSRPPIPPLDSEDEAWADELLRAKGLR